VRGSWRQSVGHDERACQQDWGAAVRLGGMKELRALTVGGRADANTFCGEVYRSQVRLERVVAAPEGNTVGQPPHQAHPLDANQPVTLPPRERVAGVPPKVWRHANGHGSRHQACGPPQLHQRPARTPRPGDVCRQGQGRRPVSPAGRRQTNKRHDHHLLLTRACTLSFCPLSLPSCLPCVSILCFQFTLSHAKWCKLWREGGR
jgi:hypothetical protein